MYSPLLWIPVTITVYGIVVVLEKRFQSALLQPLIVCAASLIALLQLLDVPYSSYSEATEPITLLLGPAIVALAIPLYRHAQSIRKTLLPVLTSIISGTVIGVALPPIIVLIFGGSDVLVLSMMPKSATTPIAMEISRALGGLPELTAIFTVLTGLIGSMIGPRVLRVFGFRDPRVIGLALGISSHAIGTARMIQESEEHGSFSGFAMALTGVCTAVLSIPFYH